MNRALTNISTYMMMVMAATPSSPTYRSITALSNGVVSAVLAFSRSFVFTVASIQILPVLQSLRSQFFQSLRNLSSQPNRCSTTQRRGSTTNLCNSLRYGNGRF
mgnify:CR=1 FL=1